MRYTTAPRLNQLLVAAGLAALTPAAAPAQANPAPPAGKSTVGTALLRDVVSVERKLLGLAEAIPETSWAWRPGDGVRSVGAVVLHVAADNYFIPTAVGVAAPAATGIKAGDYPSVQAYEGRNASKAEAIQQLRESFVHLENALKAVDDAALAQNLDLFGMKMTGLDLWVLTTTHLHEHLGQLIAYARSNGVVPPWSR